MTIRYIPFSVIKMCELKLSTETYGARASLPPSSDKGVNKFAQT